MAVAKYADPERVKKLIKGTAVMGWQEDMLEETILNLSVRMNAHFPKLEKKWQAAEEGSTLREFVRVMVSEAAKKIVTNPDAVSSETVGPYAYSKFDSEDPSKGLFHTKDVKALQDMLDAGSKKNRGAFHTNFPHAYPAYPTNAAGQPVKGRHARGWYQ